MFFVDRIARPVVERVGLARKSIGDVSHFGRRNEAKDSGGIDEAPDEPGACDPIDLRPRPRDPDRASPIITLRQMIRPHQKPFARDPSFEPALQVFGTGPRAAQPGGDALA